jgi:hypothetical protein
MSPSIVRLLMRAMGLVPRMPGDWDRDEARDRGGGARWRIGCMTCLLRTVGDDGMHALYSVLSTAELIVPATVELAGTTGGPWTCLIDRYACCFHIVQRALESRARTE